MQGGVRKNYSEEKDHRIDYSRCVLTCMELCIDSKHGAAGLVINIG